MATIARIKKASLWIEGRRPFVISIKITNVKSDRRSNHHKGQPKNEANPKRIAAKIKNSSFVSK
jgi:hypothetical protein